MISQASVDRRARELEERARARRKRRRPSEFSSRARVVVTEGQLEGLRSHLTIREMAQRLDCSPSYVVALLERFKIPHRGPKMAARVRAKRFAVAAGDRYVS